MVLVQPLRISRPSSIRIDGVLLESKQVDAERDARIGPRAIRDSCLVNRSIDVNTKNSVPFKGTEFFDASNYSFLAAANSASISPNSRLIRFCSFWLVKLLTSTIANILKKKPGTIS